MTRDDRSKLLRILSGAGRILLTSDGCGGATKLVYRVYYPRTSQRKSAVVARDGRVVMGCSMTDDVLLELASTVISELSQFLINERGGGK